jgi:hypothetical protein
MSQITLSINYWVDYRVTQFIQGVAQTPSNFTLLKGFNGYGFFEEEANPQNDSSLLQSNKTIIKPNDSPIIIAVDTEKTREVSFYYDNKLVYNKTISTSTLNDLQIEYITNYKNISDAFLNLVMILNYFQ